MLVVTAAYGVVISDSLGCVGDAGGGASVEQGAATGAAPQTGNIA